MYFNFLKKLVILLFFSLIENEQKILFDLFSSFKKFQFSLSCTFNEFWGEVKKLLSGTSSPM